MKQVVIRELTTEEVRDRIEEQTDLMRKLRMNHAVSQLENPLQLRQVRRAVARLKTELRKRQLAEESSETIAQARHETRTKKEAKAEDTKADIGETVAQSTETEQQETNKE